MTVEQVLAALRGQRLLLSDEKQLQAAMAGLFEAAALPLEREVRLSASDVIDFYGAGIGVEVKVKGSKRAIYFQLERYTKHEQIQHLILVTNVPMGLPPEIEGKPVYLHNLALAWL